MAKQPNIKAGLTSEQFNELVRVLKDPYFFAQFIYLIHPVRGKVKFDLFPFQTKLLWYFITKRFTIVLKFRQAGVTELISMYCLWLAMYHENKNVMIISLKERVAKKVLRKIKYMYKNLPDHLKVDIVNGRPGENGTATEMEFANGSIIASIPTTEDAGRSEGLSLMVIDEAAIIKFANQIWASALPTLSTGGAAIVNSTPYGVGNWYHKLWVDACSKGNQFFAIRLRWQMHPERDMTWYNEMRSQLGIRKTAQEIDGDFLTSGHNVFDLQDIRAIENMITDEYTNKLLNPDFTHELNGQLLIYKQPIKDEQYYIGADVATGRSRDYSAFSIMNRKGEEYASFKGKISVDRFADLLMEKGKIYNRAVIAPEGNDIGLAVVSKIQSSGYPALYYATSLLKEKGERKPKEIRIPGWLTTKANRPVIIDGLEEDLRNDTCEIKDPHFVAEAYTFVYDDNNKPVAMNKSSKSGAGDDEEDDMIYTDDTILAKAITNHIRKGKHKSGVYVPPAK
jgi:hypothetical protein